MFDLSKSGFGTQSQHARYAAQKIPVDLILSNEKNFYSVDDVDALAESIRISGLLEPATVVKIGDRSYRMISGHRRLKAYRQLGEKFIPAFIVEPDDLDELTMLITANSTQRKLTAAEMLEQDRQLREVYEARKAAGKEVPKNLSATIAKQMGVSRNEESRLNTTNRALIQEGKELVKDGTMNASQAYNVARQDADTQKQIVKDIKAGASVNEAITTASKKCEPVQGPGPNEAQIAVNQQIEDNRKAYAEKYRKEMELLDNCLSANLDIFLSEEVISAENRQAGIAALKKEWGTRGMSPCCGYDIMGRSSCIRITLISAAEIAEVTWTDLYDHAAMAAMKRAQGDFLEHGMKISEPKKNFVLMYCWEKGKITDDGDYACVLKLYGKQMTKIMYMRGGVLRVTEHGPGADENIEVLKWMRLPEG